jgi:hypothetical protein
MNTHKGWWKKMEYKYLLYIVCALLQVHWLLSQPVTNIQRISNLLIYEIIKDASNKESNILNFDFDVLIGASSLPWKSINPIPEKRSGCIFHMMGSLARQRDPSLVYIQ